MFSKNMAVLVLGFGLVACSGGSKSLAPVVSTPANQPGWADIAALQERVSALESEVRRLRQLQPINVSPKQQKSPKTEPEMMADMAGEMMDDAMMSPKADAMAMARPLDEMSIEELEPAAEGPMMAGNDEVMEEAMVEEMPMEQDEEKFAVHLASYRSMELAASGWSSLLEQHEDVLSGMVPMVAELNLDGSGAYYRLKAVGFADSASAMAACDALARRQQYCALSDAEGEKISQP